MQMGLVASLLLLARLSSFFLLLLLETLTGHAVDDRVEAGIHVAHAVGDTDDGQTDQQTRPEDEVEHGRILIAVEHSRIDYAVINLGRLFCNRKLLLLLL